MIMVELLDIPDSTPILTGFVTDQHYNPLIGATVLINGTSLGAMTDRDGQYIITDVPPGNYAVVAHMVGMGTETVEDVTLIENQVMQLNYVLLPIRLSPVYPWKDTVFTNTIVETDWSNWTSFYEALHIDWYRYPGEIRLEPVANAFSDTCSFFRELHTEYSEYLHRFSYACGSSTTLTRGITSWDGFDFDGNGIMEYAVLYKSRILLLYRPIHKDNLRYLAFEFPPGGMLNINDMYYPFYHTQLISDEVFNPNLILLDDLNNDGFIDVVVAGEKEHGLVSFISCLKKPFHAGSQILWEMCVIQSDSFSPQLVKMVDLNGDTYLDIVAAEEETAGYWLNPGINGNEWTMGYIAPARNRIRRIMPFDLEDDGDVDLAIRSFGEVSIFRNDGREPSEWPGISVQHLPHSNSYYASDFVHLDRIGELQIHFQPVEQAVPWQVPYKTEGRLISDIVALSHYPCSIELHWISTGTECTGESPTTVSFRVRNVENYEQVGEWSEEILEPGDILQFLEENSKWFQYEAILRTEDPNVSPILQEVTFEYSWLGSVPDRSSAPEF